MMKTAHPVTLAKYDQAAATFGVQGAAVYMTGFEEGIEFMREFPDVAEKMFVEMEEANREIMPDGLYDQLKAESREEWRQIIIDAKA